VKQKEFGVKGPEVTIIGQGTWYIDRGDRKSAVAALRRCPVRVKSVGLTRCQLLPVCPYERTSSDRPDMSRWCQ
jgi:hypothetical protein